MNLLMEKLFDRVKDNFDGAVQWYGTVKFDFEAGKLIERTATKPGKYKQATTNRYHWVLCKLGLTRITGH